MSEDLLWWCQMKTLNEAVAELKDIVEQNISNYTIPTQHNESVKIGEIVVRPSRTHGYVIIDTKKNSSVTTTYSKTGALAVALAYRKNKSLDIVKFYDKIIEKNSIDSKFYEHAIEQTEQDTKKSIIKTRLEIAQSKIETANDFLNEYIMKDIG